MTNIKTMKQCTLVVMGILSGSLYATENPGDPLIQVVTTSPVTVLTPEGQNGEAIKNLVEQAQKNLEAFKKWVKQELNNIAQQIPHNAVTQGQLKEVRDYTDKLVVANQENLVELKNKVDNLAAHIAQPEVVVEPGVLTVVSEKLNALKEAVVAQTKYAYESVKEGAAAVPGKIKQGAAATSEAVKKGAGSVKETAEKVGAQVKSAITSAYQKTSTGAQYLFCRGEQNLAGVYDAVLGRVPQLKNVNDHVKAAVVMTVTAAAVGGTVYAVKNYLAYKQAAVERERREAPSLTATIEYTVEYSELK